MKPSSAGEMLRWIQSALGSERGHEAGAPEVVQFGRLTLDRAAHRVWVDGEEVDLTAIQFKLLMTLYDNKNVLKTRDMLLDEVWDIHAALMTRTVDTHVARLRQKLKGAKAYVESVRGAGYRFVRSPEEVGN
jgi:two-component system, OmpR family, phosphate regulon response regulator PhoB